MRILVASIAWLILATSSTVQAKGDEGGVFAFCYGDSALFAYTVRFPESEPNTIVVATNFGLLVSRDNGATFGWICPVAYGAFIEPDHRLPAPPGVAVLPDGSIFALGGGVGYFRSEDGCQWVRTPDSDFETRALSSLAFRPGISTVLGAATFPGRPPFGVFKSSDGGVDFSPTSFTTDASAAFAGLHMTRGGEHVYALTSAFSEMHLWRSDTLGTEWNELLGVIDARSARLLTSGGSTGSLLYAATVENTPEPCVVSLNVLRSSNSGAMFAPLVSRDDFLVGAVAEGDDVWLGWKDSGIERVSADATITPLEALSPSVLSFLGSDRENALVACPVSPGPELVIVHDAPGARFVPLVTRMDIRGVLECPADSTVQTQCASMWDAVADRWDLGDRYVPVEPAPEGTGTDRVNDRSDAPAPPPIPPGDGGCCATIPGRTQTAVLMLSPVVFAALVRVMRKRFLS